MERTARMIVLALLFELNTRIDQIDDVGASQQVIDENTWNSSSHRPRLVLAFLQTCDIAAVRKSRKYVSS